MTSGFIRYTENVLGGTGWRDVTVWLLLGSWGDFVESAREGFSLGLYEFEYERHARDVLDAVARGYSGTDPLFADFMERLETIDSAYRELISQGPAVGPADGPWWRYRLPVHGSAELADDALRVFGVSMRVDE